MKLAIALMISAVLTGVCMVKYVDNTFSSIRFSTDTSQLQPAEALELGNSVCLQACNSPQLQQAKSVQ